MNKLCCILSSISYCKNNNIKKLYNSKNNNICKNIYNDLEIDNIHNKQIKINFLNELNNFLKHYNQYNNYNKVNIYNTSRYFNAITTYYDNKLFISFKGTDNINNWIANSTITRHKFAVLNLDYKDNKLYKNNDILIHSGLYKQFIELKPYLDYEINLYLENNINNIIFTGHSSGGVIASICNLYYSLKYSQINTKCYTYGSPIICNKTFVNIYNNLNNSYNYINYNDPIQIINKLYNYNYSNNLNNTKICNNTINYKILKNNNKYNYYNYNEHYIYNYLYNLNFN
jgi:predicted lipase